MSEGTIDDILNGREPEPVIEDVAEVTPEVTEPEVTATQPRDEHGRFAPKGENKPEEATEPAPAQTAPPAVEESGTVPRTALQDERRKRQELERQLQELMARQPAPVPQPVPDQWEDPEGFNRYLAEQAAAVAEERAFQRMQHHRVQISAEAAKAKYPDYLDAVAEFERMAVENPALTTRMFEAPDPAEFAYRLVQQNREISKYGSLDEMKAALRREWEAEALAKLKAEVPAQTSAPTSLATERNVGSRSGPEWAGPTPLSDLLR